MRKNIAAGNWKMNTDLQSAKQLASEVANMARDEVNTDVQIVLNPPFPFLSEVIKLVEGNDNIGVGAQNCHQEASGAYTGEVSIDMLTSIGVEYVILGHSERREFFEESYEELEAKTKAVLAKSLKPIFCCGEKLEVREQNQHFELVKEQIEKSLFSLTSDEVKQVIIAYEPVWAIGTGVTASAEQAQEMHAFIRNVLSEKYGGDVAEEISILYGGSVKPGNAQELFACPDLDGGLVGGASLQSRDFVDIAKSF